MTALVGVAAAVALILAVALARATQRAGDDTSVTAAPSGASSSVSPSGSPPPLPTEARFDGSYRLVTAIPNSAFSRMIDVSSSCSEGPCRVQVQGIAQFEPVAFTFAADFDGSEYSGTAQPDLYCPQGGEDRTIPYPVTVRYRFTPTRAELVDGVWTVTEVRGSGRTIAKGVTIVVDGTRFNCTAVDAVTDFTYALR